MKFIYADGSQVSHAQIAAGTKLLLPYLKQLRIIAASGNYTSKESSINLAFDENLMESVEALVREKTSPLLKYIVVVGIGGSNLGTRAIYDALYGHADTVTPNDRFPKMFFADTNDSEILKSLCQFLERGLTYPEQILIVIVTKSGITTETIANAEYLLSELGKKHTNIFDRTVCITGKDSPLWKQAKEKNISLLSIPEMVGGRYSIFSAVGLFPLAVLGIDIGRLVAGIRTMRDRCLDESAEKNPALASAIITYLHSKEERRIHNTFIFHPELSSLGAWYRQLMGESIGKKEDVHGKVIHAGITPITSIGSTDLHSVGQLYFDGPDDKLTTFVSSDTTDTSIRVPKTRLFPKSVPGIENTSFSEIMSAILTGVKIAYTKHKLPFTEAILDDVSAYSLGEFLQWKMCEMMFLGKLLGVNTFDQPGVEAYKSEARHILSPP